MGIGSFIVKGVVKGAKYLFKAPLKNSENIVKARKAVPGSIFSKAKRQAGWKAFKADVKATKVEPTLGKSLKKLGSTLLKPFKMAGKAIKKCFQKGGLKVVGKWLGKVGKSAWKCLKGIPILGTVIAAGCEIPGIVQSFKEGGFWKGMAHIGLSTVKIGVASVASIAATAFGGPVAGGAAYLAVDAGLSGIQDKIMGHTQPQQQQPVEQAEPVAEDVVETQNQEQTQPQADEASTTNTADNKLTDNNSADNNSAETSTTQEKSAPSSSTVTTPALNTGLTQMPLLSGVNPSLGLGLNNPFGGVLPQFQPFMPAFNFGSGIGLGSGLGFGLGLGSGLGGGLGFGLGNYQNPYALNIKI